MEKLEGRDVINKYAIAKKVNEIIEILEAVGIIDEEGEIKEYPEN